LKSERTENSFNALLVMWVFFSFFNWKKSCWTINCSFHSFVHSFRIQRSFFSFFLHT
jgi:hypothetical protein